MAMFAVFALKVLFFIWVAQLVWIGSLLLRRPVKRILQYVLTVVRPKVSVQSVDGTP
jgi:hypothetical protein